MAIGSEQIYRPDSSLVERIYIALFGIPIIGLRIRARNVFSLIPTDRTYRHILDAGSGPGVFSFELSRRFPEAQVVGVDLIRDEINGCLQIAKRANIKNVEFRHSAVEDLSEKGIFDLVLSVDVMEHIEDDLRALRGLFEAAAYGGIFVLHVPALYRRYPVWRKRLNFDVPTHVRTGYEPSEIVAKVKEAGFSVINSGFTYGFCETLANNISYMITGARKQNRVVYAFAFPLLNLLALIGRGARPDKLGAGVYVVAEKSPKE